MLIIDYRRVLLMKLHTMPSTLEPRPRLCLRTLVSKYSSELVHANSNFVRDECDCRMKAFVDQCL